MAENNKPTVCLLAMTPSEKDKRTFEEARLLVEHGLHCTVLGPKRSGEEEREWIGNVEVLRLPFRPIFGVPRRWYAGRRYTHFVRMFQRARRLKSDYYHAHQPLSLMIVAYLCARVTGRRFFGDFNDIINHRLASDRERKAASTRDTAYYDLEDVWGTELSDIDKDRIASIEDLMPEGVATVLDAGCGDGKLVKNLAGGRVTFAFDTSGEALKYVNGAKFRASMDNIPAEDNAFDLILCTEVLEHLPPGVYPKALKELARVSKKYLLVEVPHRQQLAFAAERCGFCGTKFHANHHYRSFSLENSRGLFGRRWRLVDHRLCGGNQFYHHGILLWIRQRLGGVWAKSPIGFCTRCNTRQFITGYRERNAISGWCADRNKKWRERKPQQVKSQMIVLYEKLNDGA